MLPELKILEGWKFGRLEGWKSPSKIYMYTIEKVTMRFQNTGDKWKILKPEERVEKTSHTHKKIKSQNGFKFINNHNGDKKTRE